MTLENYVIGWRRDGDEDIDEPACQMTEVRERRMSLCEHASECLKCSPHTSFMFSSLNNKQNNPIPHIYTSGTIPFHLSKYIIYIILEYIKYRIGTIPFSFLQSIATTAVNHSRSQFLFFFFFRFVCVPFENMIFKNKFWLLSDSDRFVVQCNGWPSTNNEHVMCPSLQELDVI